MISHDTDHIAESIALLAQQLSGSTSHKRIVTVFGNRTQEVEDLLFGMIGQRALASGQNAQLDAIGKLVGEPRDGRDDPTYRPALYVRILINRSSGEAPILVRITELLLPGRTFQYSNVGTAAYIISVKSVGISDATALGVFSALEEATAGGVNPNLQYEANGHTDADTFTLDGTSNQSLDAGYLSGIL